MKSSLKPLAKEFASGKITNEKLYPDGENYLQWRKIVEIRAKK